MFCILCHMNYITCAKYKREQLLSTYSWNPDHMFSDQEYIYIYIFPSSLLIARPCHNICFYLFFQYKGISSNYANNTHCFSSWYALQRERWWYLAVWLKRAHYFQSHLKVGAGGQPSYLMNFQIFYKVVHCESQQWFS